jgi:hypothetical protein
MTSFAQKVAMWVGAIVIAIALGGLAFWIAGNIGKNPADAQKNQPPTPTAQQPQTLADVQVTGTVTRTNATKLEIIISEVVLESPSNITLCRTENILVRLRQTDPLPSENVRVRIKGEYNHQECSITLKNPNHSISIITGVIYHISLTGTISEMDNARTLIKVKVLEVKAGPEPCTRENLTVRLKEPLSSFVNIQDKADIEGNYNSATCEVRLDTPDTSISFPPVSIELRGTVRSVGGNRYILYNWEVQSGPPTCAGQTRADLTIMVSPGPNVKQVPPNSRAVVKGNYSPADCIIRVEGTRSDHAFLLEEAPIRHMKVEGVVSFFESRQRMELANLKMLEGDPPCDASKLVVDLTDRIWRDTVKKVGDKVRVEGDYYETECKLYPKSISKEGETPPFPFSGFISAGLILNSQLTLYSAGVGIEVYNRIFLQGIFGTGSGTAKTKTGVTMSLNVTTFVLSASYQVFEEFYLSTGAGALLVRQSIVTWSQTLFVPVVRICLGYRVGKIFMVEGGFYVSLGPAQ